MSTYNDNTTSYGDSAWSPGMTTDVQLPALVVGGNMKAVTMQRTVIGVGWLKRGTVLGQITAAGSMQGWFTMSKAAANDGSQVPCALLVDDSDCDGGVLTGTYEQGEFFDDAVLFDPSFTLQQVRDALASKAIFLKTPISAGDPS